MKKLIIFAIAISALIVLGQHATGAPQSPPSAPAAAAPANPTPKNAANQNEFYDLLILGIDRRPQQKTGRSDVILIVHCEPDHITFFSIPRDTLTQVRSGKDKINHAYAYGGIRLSKVTIERFLKFKVDNYVILDFETFMTTIDVIKALTDDGRLIGAENFLMSGENLLKWLRFRTLPGGDRRRAQRHQLFMKRVFEYTQDMFNNQRSVFKQCMMAGLKVADSDLTYEHVEQLYDTYKNFDLENNLERYVLPGYAASRRRDGTAPPPVPDEPPPDLSYIDNDPNLTPEQKAAKKKAIMADYHKKVELISFYIPKYDWSLVTYVHFYRNKGIKINYVEEDTLRK